MRSSYCWKNNTTAKKNTESSVLQVASSGGTRLLSEDQCSSSFAFTVHRILDAGYEVRSRHFHEQRRPSHPLVSKKPFPAVATSQNPRSSTPFSARGLRSLEGCRRGIECSSPNRRLSVALHRDSALICHVKMAPCYTLAVTTSMMIGFHISQFEAAIAKAVTALKLGRDFKGRAFKLKRDFKGRDVSHLDSLVRQ